MMPSSLKIHACALTALLLAGAAQASVIGSDGRRPAVGDELPHAAIGSLVDLDSGALCTGIVVAADIVLTEAHCALRPAKPADCAWPKPADACGAGALHIRDLRFLPDDNARIPRADKYALSIAAPQVLAYGDGFRSSEAPGRYFLQRHDDWAFLKLATPLDVRRYPPLRVAQPDFAAIIGTPLTMPGYSADRYYRDGDPSYDTDCKLDYVERVESGRTIGLIRDDCDSTSGASGSPILMRERDGGWSVIGMHTDGPDPRYPHQAVGDANYGTPSSAFFAMYKQLLDRHL
jgi:protease YdgD